MKSVGILLLSWLWGVCAHAQYFPAGGGESSAPSKSRFAFTAGYAVPSANYTVAGATAVHATGTGFSGGVEFQSSTNWPNGIWALGLRYELYSLQMSPNGVREIDRFQAIELPLTWGHSLGPHFLLSAGLCAHYDLDNIRRESGGATTGLSHEDFGVGVFQLEALASLRYLQKMRGRDRFFLEFAYGQGLLDRAIGEGDTWRDQTWTASFALLL